MKIWYDEKINILENYKPNEDRRHSVLKLRVPKNRIHYVLRQLAKCGDPDEAERGWALFHKGGVLDVKAGGAHRGSALTIEAIVKDGDELLETTLDLETFGESSCSCGQELPCVHMTAVTFALYEPHGRTEMLLQELKALIVKTMHTRHKERAALPASKPEAPAQSGNPADWHAYFARKFSGFAISHSYTFEMFAQAVWDSLPAYAAGWAPARERIFALHVALFALRKIEDFYSQSKSSSYLSAHHIESCKSAVDTCKEKLLQAVDDCMHVLRPEDETLWQSTLRILGKYALRGVSMPVDWLQVYREVWCRLIERPALAKAEEARVDRLLSPQSRGSERDALMAAKAHFLVMEGRLDEAMRLLGELNKLLVKDVYFYLHRHSSREEWTLLLKWLRWLLPLMRTADADEFRSLCQYWAEAAKHTDADREWVEVMEDLLPRSYYVYTTYLLQTKRYEQWVDLQLSTRVSPLQLYALELRAVEKAKPELLLPLYHQAAERSVLEKNRSSYLTAMKMLSKLEELYRTLGRTADWERFLSGFASKFSRLRAFQNELKKHHWVP